MKKLFSIILIAAVLAMGGAQATTVLTPEASGACVYGRAAMPDTVGDGIIRHVDYSAKDRYMDVTFGVPVLYGDELTVTVTDPEGSIHEAEIIGRSGKVLTVWVDGLAEFEEHTITVSTLAAEDAEAYPEYAEQAAHSAPFTTIPRCCI